MIFNQKYDWFWHIVEALCMALVFGAPWYFLLNDFAVAAAIGLAFGTGHFHGREKRDCEVKFKIPSPHLVSYDFRRWNYDQLTDFFPVAAVCITLMLVLLYG